MTDAGYLGSDYELVLHVVPEPGAARTSRTTRTSPAGTPAAACSTWPTWRSPATRRCRCSRRRCGRRPPTPASATWTRAGSSTATRCAPTTRPCAACSSRSAIWDENAARQSFHPNARGHGMFADCMTAVRRNSRLPPATCVDPARTGAAPWSPGCWSSSSCATRPPAPASTARATTPATARRMQSYTCHGGRNQGFWYDADAPVAARGAVPRPVPGRGRQPVTLRHGGATCTTATAPPTSSGSSPATSSSRPAATGAVPGLRHRRCSARPRLRLATCSSQTRQQWSFEPRTLPTRSVTATTTSSAPASGSSWILDDSRGPGPGNHPRSAGRRTVMRAPPSGA